MDKILQDVINTIENIDIRKFAEECVNAAADYWTHVPASSSGRFHPSYALGDGGLLRHTVALIKILNHMFGVESIANQFTSEERDLLRVAGLAHDMMKSGTQEDYEKSKWTKFDHPLLAANMIRNLPGLDEKKREFIAHVIESHMGAFNTDKRHPDIVLPKPTDKYQIILHLADYLASRKDIEIKFDNTGESKINNLAPHEPATLENYAMPFGKHKGKLLPQIQAEDPGYIAWARKEIKKEPLYSLLFQLPVEE